MRERAKCVGDIERWIFEIGEDSGPNGGRNEVGISAPRADDLAISGAGDFILY